MKVSVIIPIYNIANYLYQCIDSIVSQTYTDIEIILVNDGSTDDSLTICQQFLVRDSRIKLINQPNSGLVFARIAGLNKATGDYVLNVDGDDWISANCIERLVYTAITSSSDIVISAFYKEFVGKEVIVKPSFPEGVYTKERLKRYIFPTMIFNNRSCNHDISTYSWGKLFKIDLLIKHQSVIPLDISIGEDAVVTYPCIADAESISIIHEPLYYYRQRSGSMLKLSLSADKELKKVNTMCDLLLSRLGGGEFFKQVEAYRFTMLAVRTGGLLRKSLPQESLFSTNLDFSSKRIALYSSGTFGQAIWGAFSNAGLNFSGWFDEDFYESQICGLNVSPLKDLAFQDVDIVLVAAFNKNIFQSVKKNILPLVGKSCIIAQPVIPKTLAEDST
jgi:glycosyltransferase involved in cell wall biosynthesis